MILPAQSPINATCDAYHALCIALCQHARATLPHRSDVAFGEHPEQRLDIYCPPAPGAALLPIFLNIHGGGWTHGYKEWMALDALAITAFPAIYVSLGYRLAPDAKHPAQIEDCLAAIAWLGKNGESFGGDPRATHIGGHSAGAQIAVLASLRTDLQAAHGLPPGAIRSCFGYSGLYDLRGSHARPVVPGLSAAPMLASAADETDASPIAWARRVPTRFHLSWGAAETDDFTVGGRALADLLLAAGNDVTVSTPELDHFWMHLDHVRPDSAWNVALRATMANETRLGSD